MRKIETVFGGIRMTWPRVLVLAVGTAAMTAAFNVLPMFADTSFQDMAVNLDFWFLPAIFVVTNCDSWKEAAIKCFIFFLVSQPLIYLFETPFLSAGFGLFGYYDFWFKMTLLTLPGGAIAYQIKRGDWLGTAALSVAAGYFAFQSVFYLRRVMIEPPHHLISLLFCVGMIILLTLTFVKDKKQRLAVFLLCIAVFAAVGRKNGFGILPDVQEYEITPGTWTVETAEPGIVTVEADENGHVTVTSGKEGNTMIYLTDQDGNVREWHATVSGGKIWLTRFDLEE